MFILTQKRAIEIECEVIQLLDEHPTIAPVPTAIMHLLSKSYSGEDAIYAGWCYGVNYHNVVPEDEEEYANPSGEFAS